MQLLIEIELCRNCHLHSWCSRHDEIKYIDYYQQIAKRIVMQIPGSKIIQRKPPDDIAVRKSPANDGALFFNINTGQAVHFPRLGSFQIYVQRVRIFSKLKSKIWPKFDKVIEKLKSLQQTKQNGEDLAVFDVDYVDPSSKPKVNADLYNIQTIFRVRKASVKNQTQCMASTGGKQGSRLRQLNKSLDLDKRLSQFNPEFDALFEQVHAKPDKQTTKWLQKWNLQEAPYNPRAKPSPYLGQVIPKQKRRKLLMSKLDSKHIILENETGQRIMYKKQQNADYQKQRLNIDSGTSGANTIRATSRHNRRKLAPLPSQNTKNHAKINQSNLNNHIQKQEQNLYDELDLSQKQKEQLLQKQNSTINQGKQVNSKSKVQSKKNIKNQIQQKLSQEQYQQQVIEQDQSPKEITKGNTKSANQKQNSEKQLPLQKKDVKSKIGKTVKSQNQSQKEQIIKQQNKQKQQQQQQDQLKYEEQHKFDQLQNQMKGKDGQYKIEDQQLKQQQDKVQQASEIEKQSQREQQIVQEQDNHNQHQPQQIIEQPPDQINQKIHKNQSKVQKNIQPTKQTLNQKDPKNRIQQTKLNEANNQQKMKITQNKKQQISKQQIKKQGVKKQDNKVNSIENTIQKDHKIAEIEDTNHRQSIMSYPQKKWKAKYMQSQFHLIEEIPQQVNVDKKQIKIQYAQEKWNGEYIEDNFHLIQELPQQIMTNSVINKEAKLQIIQQSGIQESIKKQDKALNKQQHPIISQQKQIVKNANQVSDIKSQIKHKNQKDIENEISTEIKAQIKNEAKVGQKNNDELAISPFRKQIKPVLIQSVICQQYSQMFEKFENISWDTKVKYQTQQYQLILIPKQEKTINIIQTVPEKPKQQQKPKHQQKTKNIEKFIPNPQKPGQINQNLVKSQQTQLKEQNKQIQWDAYFQQGKYKINKATFQYKEHQVNIFNNQQNITKIVV